MSSFCVQPEHQIGAVAEWLDGASAWMADMVTARAVYPQRRGRAGEYFPVRFAADELEGFLAGLQTAAATLSAMLPPLPAPPPAAPIPPPPPARTPLPAYMRIIK